MGAIVDGAGALPEDGARLPELPEGAEQPRIGERCPQGWAEVLVTHRADLVACDPWFEEEGHDPFWPSGQEHFMGGASCERVTTECAGIPEGLPQGTVFVHAGDDGTGTREAPFGNLAQAREAAPDGGTIFVASGEYQGPFPVTRDLTIVGECDQAAIIGDTR